MCGILWKAFHKTPHLWNIGEFALSDEKKLIFAANVE